MRSIQRERISRFLVRRSRYEYWRAFSTLSLAILIQFLALPLNPFANLNTSFLFILSSLLSSPFSTRLAVADTRWVSDEEQGFGCGLFRFKLLLLQAHGYSRLSRPTNVFFDVLRFDNCFIFLEVLLCIFTILIYIFIWKLHVVLLLYHGASDNSF